MSGLTMLPGRDYLLTLTAPGAEPHLLPGRRLECPCTRAGHQLDDEISVAVWNGRAVGNWNRFHQAVERRLGVTLKYFKAVEVQRRGALHLHVLVRVEKPCKIRVSALRAMAIRHGFGHEVDWQPVSDERAAWYVSKYVTKCSDERADVPYLHSRTGELGPGRWRTWTSSRTWGDSMRSLRQAQARWVEENRAGRMQGGGPTESVAACADGVGALDLYGTYYAQQQAIPLGDLVTTPM